MEFVWFNLFSTLETIGTFSFMLALFRFKIKEYIFHIIFVSFLLSQTSFLVRSVFELDMYVPIVYLFFTFLFVWLMFQVQIFHAAIMTIIGQIVSILVQSLTLVTCIQFGIFTWDDVGAFSVLSYTMQTITFLQMAILSLFLYKKRLGFTFIPNTETFKVNMKNKNIWSLLLLLLSVLFVCLNLFWVWKNLSNLFISSVLFLLLFLIWIYVGIRKEIQAGSYEL